MMIVNLPRRARRLTKSGPKRQRFSINAVLRDAYRRYGKNRLTAEAVKRCLGT